MQRNRYKVVGTGHGYYSLEIETEKLRKIDAQLIDADTYPSRKLVSLLKEADAIMVGATKITEEIVASLEKCKVIAEYGVGCDNIAVEEATKKRIYVVNVPGYGTDAVADNSMAILLCLARKICLFDRSVKRGIWDRKIGVPIHRLRGQILGIVGFGRIGKAVCSRAIPFGLKVLVFDPYVSSDEIEKYGAKLVSFGQLLKESDCISLHIPLTKETSNLFNEGAFRMMKKSAYIVNAARGAVVDEVALHKAIKEKWIAGAGLDVFRKHPPDPDNPLLKLDEVIVTPHTAWYSEESERELRIRVVEEVIRVLSGESPKSPVNVL